MHFHPSIFWHSLCLNSVSGICWSLSQHKWGECRNTHWAGPSQYTHYSISNTSRGNFRVSNWLKHTCTVGRNWSTDTGETCQLYTERPAVWSQVLLAVRWECWFIHQNLEDCYGSKWCKMITWLHYMITRQDRVHANVSRYFLST